MSVTCDNVYTFCFKLPRRSNLTAESGPSKNKSYKIKDLVTTNSYPSISVNIKQYVLFINEEYIEATSTPITKDKKTSIVRGSFRTRNKFIIARNLLCRLVKHEKALSSTEISKVVSLIWKESNKSLHDYFEYLSLMEAFWYDKLMLSYGNSTLRTTASAAVSVRLRSVPYENLCASCYSKQRQKRSFNYDYSKPAKFRVHKDFKEKKRTIFSIKDHTNKFEKIQDTFRINQCTITTNFGIVTEDMFFSSLSS